MSDYFHSFNAVRGIQAGRPCYIAMCPMYVIPKIFVFNEEEMWDYLQNFAFLGLQEIEKWFAERPHVEPKDVILDKMKEVAIKEGLGN